MKKSTAIITATVLTLGIVGGVAAYKGDGGFRHHGWHRGEHFIAHVRDELDLTPEQTAALEGLRDRLWEIRRSVKQDREADRQVVLQMIQGEVLDEAAALQLVADKTDMVTAHAPQVIAMVAEFYNGLSAQQQAEVRERIAAHMRRHRHD